MKKVILFLLLLTGFVRATDIKPPNFTSSWPANTFPAAPDGSAGVMVQRQITTTDVSFMVNLPALNASLLTSLNASQLTSGTVPTARFPGGAFNGASELVQLTAAGKYPALDGSLITSIPASNTFTYTTTMAGGGTTTLTASSTLEQFFTGTTGQTVVLPLTSTLVLGRQFWIKNDATGGSLFVQSSGTNPIATMATNSAAVFTCVLTSGTTAASWSVQYVPAIFIYDSANHNLYSQDTLLTTPPTGTNNYGTGYQALQNLSSGIDNIAIGYQALNTITAGQDNTAIGYTALSSAKNNQNTAVGSGALGSVTGTVSGSGGNTAVGMNAGSQIIGGTFNTVIGQGAGPSSSGLNKTIAIGYNSIPSANSVATIGGTGADAVSVGIGTGSPSETLQVVGNVKAVQFKGLIQDIPINSQINSYTLALTDNQELVTMTNSASTTITIPPNSGTGSVAFNIGTQILVAQAGTGTATITQGTGVTIVSRGAVTTAPVTGGYGAMVGLIKIGTNTWLVTGDIQ